MCAQHKEAQHLQIVFLTDFTDGKEISEGFGHLLVIDVQEAIVHPVICKGLVVCCLRLRDFILVMREDKILTACMDIDLLTQVLLGHDRTLNMPARTTLAPRGLPVRLAFFFRLPENEIGRILLVFLTGYLQFTKA